MIMYCHCSATLDHAFPQYSQLAQRARCLYFSRAVMRDLTWSSRFVCTLSEPPSGSAIVRVYIQRSRTCLELIFIGLYSYIYFYSSSATFLTQRKRSIWHKCKKCEYWRPTDRPTTSDQRPTSGPIHTFWKISNAHNSVTRHPIHFVSGSWWGLQGRRIERRYFRNISNPSWRLVGILKKN